MSARRKANGS